jgi:hypothetical protein
VLGKGRALILSPAHLCSRVVRFCPTVQKQAGRQPGLCAQGSEQDSYCGHSPEAARNRLALLYVVPLPSF